jgi:2,5-diketo-D-gluconate reductase A
VRDRVFGRGGRVGNRYDAGNRNERREPAVTAVPDIHLNNGQTIPQLGFGVFQIKPDDTVEATSQALDAGYRHIDTAQMYGNEREVGQAIDKSGIERRDVFLTSKLNNGAHLPDDARTAFDGTLEALGFDYIDLFLIHWPLPTLYDGDYVSTWWAVCELVADGRLRSAGVSNFQPPHLERIIDATGIVPAINQFEIHPYFNNDAPRAACQQHGIAIEAHSPLGHNGEPLKDTTIAGIAAEHGKSVAQVILRWHIQNGIIAIPKSGKPDRMAENLDIFDFELTAANIAAINALDRGATGRVGPNPDTYEGI